MFRGNDFGKHFLNVSMKQNAHTYYHNKQWLYKRGALGWMLLMPLISIGEK